MAQNQISSLKIICLRLHCKQKTRFIILKFRWSVTKEKNNSSYQRVQYTVLKCSNYKNGSTINIRSKITGIFNGWKSDDP